MNGCEIMKCIDYKDGKCHYESAMCKYKNSRMEGQEAKDLLFEAQQRITELEARNKLLEEDIALKHQAYKEMNRINDLQLTKAEAENYKLKCDILDALAETETTKRLTKAEDILKQYDIGIEKVIKEIQAECERHKGHNIGKRGCISRLQSLQENIKAQDYFKQTK